MNKEALIAKVAEKTGMTKKNAAAAIDAAMETIVEAVASGTKVILIGFGKFEKVQRAERVGRNPQTGESVSIPARFIPKFTPGRAFKDAVQH